VSQIELNGQHVVIAIFAMGECPACESYLPRFLVEVEALRQQGFPFVVYVEGQPIPQGAIPVLVYDAASPNVDVQAFADKYGVTATPTTLVLSRGIGSFKAEGSLANNQIQWILMMAHGAQT
jgi:thiol-disulfide isomerase/thioredoxin